MFSFCVTAGLLSSSDLRGRLLVHPERGEPRSSSDATPKAHIPAQLHKQRMLKAKGTWFLTQTENVLFNELCKHHKVSHEKMRDCFSQSDILWVAQCQVGWTG